MSDWQEASLADLADYINGRAIKPEECSIQEGIPVIRIKQINDPQSIEDRFCGDDLEEKNIARSGDLLFSWSATLKTILWQGPTGAINQHIFKVLPKEGIDKTFLHYLIDNSLPALTEESHGSTMKHIKKSALSAFHLQIPPLPEQKKIAEILSGIDKSISINCQKITSLETLYASILADSLKKLPGDCLEIQLADACSEVFLGLTSKVDYVENEGVPLVRASNIKNGLIDFNATRSISQDQHLSLTKYRKAGKGDVLVTKSGSLGECAIVHTEKEFSIYESIVCLKPRSDLLSTKYLFHALQSRAIKDQFLSEKVGSAVAHLNLNDFRRITLLLPSLVAQKVISKTLDALRSNKDRLKADTDKKIYLKSAISSDLLSGRKRVSI